MGRATGVTIRDVAHRAGVSIAAVSMALNDTGTLSAATRARVRAVAEEMEYQADALARGLRRSSVGAIGLVVRSLDEQETYELPGVDIFTRYIGAGSVAAMSRGLSLMLVPDLTKAPTPPLALSLDGYIVLLPHAADPVIALLQRRHIPYVTLARDPHRPDFVDWAAEDDVASTRRVLDHLRSSGAHSIALLQGTESNAWNIDCELSYRSWCAAHVTEPRVYSASEASGETGGEAMARHIVADGVPDAIVCQTGAQAAGMLVGLAGLGVSVPERTLLATLSDSENARRSRPAITALELNPTATMNALVDLLQARIAGLPSAGPILTNTRLRVRASSRRAEAHG